VRKSYIAFLRAVNVGGRIVPMERLRAVLGKVGLGDVRTFIQSGNVFFTAEGKREAIAKSIEQALEKTFGFAVPAMLRTPAEVEATLAAFAGPKPSDPDVRHLVLFASRPLPASLSLPLHLEKQRFTLARRTKTEVFCELRVGGGRVANPCAYLEKTCDLFATARFYHTTQKILDAARA
jgi:uncharacterized protein (DUF1697 family)